MSSPRQTFITSRSSSYVTGIICAFTLIATSFTSAADPPPAPRIKIGVLALHFEARATGPTGSRRLDILKHFPADQFDVRPITDPDAEADPAADEIVHKAFGSAEPIDGSSADKLEALDVIISPREWQVRSEIISAIHHAVSDGVGLLDQTTIGRNQPGYADQKVLDLHGMARAAYFYYASTRGDVTCTRAADHALLDGMANKPPTVRGLNGVIGEFHGTGLFAAPPLTDVFNADNLAPADPDHPPVFYPLYVAQLGRGRIVGCQWYIPDPPPALVNLKGGDFYARVADWLADGRAKAAQANSEAAAATQPVH